MLKIVNDPVFGGNINLAVVDHQGNAHLAQSLCQLVECAAKMGENDDFFNRVAQQRDKQFFECLCFCPGRDLGGLINEAKQFVTDVYIVGALSQ